MADEKRNSKTASVIKKYFAPPFIFVLISLLLVIPLSLVMLHTSVNSVHKAQRTFAPHVADFEAYDDGFTPSGKTDGKAVVKTPAGFSKIGELRCESAGLATSVYYGNNRVSYRKGAGLSTEFSLPGEGKAIKISANPGGGFKALYNVKKGEVITLTTGWGTYQYRVTDVTDGQAVQTDGEVLYMTTAASKKPFAALNGKTLTVCAQKLSGPVAEEVQDEQ